jgi:outer membrane protein assembly factor BamB
VAIYEGKVFVGTLDGRLIALNAATGMRVPLGMPSFGDLLSSSDVKAIRAYGTS